MLKKTISLLLGISLVFAIVAGVFTPVQADAAISGFASIGASQTNVNRTGSVKILANLSGAAVAGDKIDFTVSGNSDNATAMQTPSFTFVGGETSKDSILYVSYYEQKSSVTVTAKVTSGAKSTSTNIVIAINDPTINWGTTTPAPVYGYTNFTAISAPSTYNGTGSFVVSCNAMAGNYSYTTIDNNRLSDGLDCRSIYYNSNGNAGVEIYPSALSRLSIGWHTLRVHFLDGTFTHTFYISQLPAYVPTPYNQYPNATYPYNQYPYTQYPNIVDPYAAQGAKTVSASRLVVRSGPGTNFMRLGTLTRGTVVNVQSYANGWALINYNGIQAYVSSAYLR